MIREGGVPVTVASGTYINPALFAIADLESAGMSGAYAAGVFTAPFDGLFKVEASLDFDSSAANGLDVRFVGDDVPVFGGGGGVFHQVLPAVPTGGSVTTVFASGTSLMSSGDAFHVEATHFSGVSIDVTPDSLIITYLGSPAT